MRDHLLRLLLVVLLSWDSASSSARRRVRSHGNGTESSSVGGSCFSIRDCGECTGTYGCHWCKFDGACHAKGSVHGCPWGSTCQAPEPTPPSPPEKKGCGSHATCSECASSSRGCHWCAFDNACHAVGSPRGCASGVDCYSNERCRRKVPEEFPTTVVTEMPGRCVALVIVVAFVVVVAVLVDWSRGCCGSRDAVSGGRGRRRPPSAGAGSGPVPPSVAIAVGISLTTDAMAPGGTPGTAYSAVETEAPAERGFEATGDGSPGRQPSNEATADDGDDDPSAILPFDHVPGTSTVYVEMADATSSSPAAGDENDESAYLLENQTGVEGDDRRQIIPRPPRNKSMRRLFCRWMKISSAMLVVLVAFLSIYFFPVVPAFSVCNDSVGWAKIVEHIIALRIDASFEVLVSLSNSNRIAVALDAGSGTFRFDGRPLGTFVIPPFTMDGMAVSDMMILAKATPDRQQAYRIVQAYLNKSLILDADIEATVRLPTPFNYTTNVTIGGYPVDVTAPQDRTLCKCPTWNGELPSPRISSSDVAADAAAAAGLIDDGGLGILSGDGKI